MSDFGNLSPFEPPADPAELADWLVAQEERITRRTVRAMERIVGDATTGFLDTLVAASGDMSMFDAIPLQWMLFVEDYLTDELTGMYLSGGLTAWIGAEGKVPANLIDEWVPVVNRSAEAYSKVMVNRMQDVGLTTWNTIKDQVTKAITNGDSIEDTRDTILKTGEFSRYRAELIARTETIGAYNNGNWESQQALGEFGPTYKYWSAFIDNRTRQAHVDANQQVKLMSEPFLVGGEEMMFPHSPGGSPGNVCFCRCQYYGLWPGDPHPVTGVPLPDPVDWVG